MATATEKRNEAVRLMKSRKGKNKYSQGRPGNFWGEPNGGTGSGDCSLSVEQAIKRAAGISIGGNTNAQVVNAKNGKGQIVDRPSGLYFDESKLEKGDCLYFRGNTSHTDDVGHVEMYTGKNECTGHGGGTGPTVKNLKSYCAGRTGSRRALYAVRWIAGDEKVYKLGERDLSRGMVAPDVGELQSVLKLLGHDLGKYGANKDGIDSDYGSMTAAAVKAEQAAYGMARTGDADMATIQAILATASGVQPAPTKQRVRITGGIVNVRTGPGTGYKDVGDVYDGNVFDCTGESAEGWIGIWYKNEKRWVSLKYAQIVS